MAALASTSRHEGDTYEPRVDADGAPIDASLTVRDSSAKAFMRELRKVIERSDVIIQVLDARDPEGTRSRWVEDEVRKRDAQGKKLLAVVNKIDLVPRANLEAWIKYLRHSFPTMPFKSSTQSQRQNLSQNPVPLVKAAAGQIGSNEKLEELPVTSSSLGAPALLGLLKQYALTSPHSALTVGVVGYPNVGKSSLINSLKRSRACGVAAMPGKTRVVQEVVLDKGVKILDCPGVVLEDIGQQMYGLDEAASRRRQAEIMLRNCVKAELVEDPISPIQVILDRADPNHLMNMYNLPSWDDSRDFLIKLALTRGRLGRGGIPDLEGSAIQVLRDWNSGKIPYFTRPPAVHPSSAPAPVVEREDGDEAMGETGAAVGDAKILNSLSEAFTIDGLFDDIGDEADWQGEEETEGMQEEQELEAPLPAPIPVTAAAAAPSHWTMPLSPSSSVSSRASLRDSMSPPPRPGGSLGFGNGNGNGVSYPARAAADPARLFTADELAFAPQTSMQRQRAKKAEKKAKKRRAAAEQTEGELLLGFMDMDVEEGEEAVEPVKTAKQKREERKAKKPRGEPAPVDEEKQKEDDFAKFLATMGAEEDDEL